MAPPGCLPRHQSPHLPASDHRPTRPDQSSPAHAAPVQWRPSGATGSRTPLSRPSCAARVLPAGTPSPHPTHAANLEPPPAPPGNPPQDAASTTSPAHRPKRSAQRAAAATAQSGTPPPLARSARSPPFPRSTAARLPAPVLHPAPSRAASSVLHCHGKPLPRLPPAPQSGSLHKAPRPIRPHQGPPPKAMPAPQPLPPAQRPLPAPRPSPRSAAACLPGQSQCPQAVQARTTASAAPQAPAPPAAHHASAVMRPMPRQPPPPHRQGSSARLPPQSVDMGSLPAPTRCGHTCHLFCSNARQGT